MSESTSLLSQVDVSRFRTILLEERRRLMRALHPSQHWSAGDSQGEITGDLSDYPDHPADLASETFEREKDLTIRGNARDLLERVEDALRKMDNGTYGICSNCKQPIPEGRLRAMPSAVYCVKCQSAMGGL